MPEVDDTSPGRRVPYAAAALACASVGLAVWLWMRFSYAWDVTPKSLQAFVQDECDWCGLLDVGRYSPDPSSTTLDFLCSNKWQLESVLLLFCRDSDSVRLNLFSPRLLGLLGL